MKDGRRDPLLPAVSPDLRRAALRVRRRGVRWDPLVVAVAGSSEPPVVVTPKETATGVVSATPAPTAIAWQTSELEARHRAKARELPLAFLFAEWAVPAVRMDRDTWTDPRIVARSRGFVALRLDVSDADANAQAEADHFDSKTMPSTILLDDAGRELGRLEGFASADDVLAALARADVPGD